MTQWVIEYKWASLNIRVLLPGCELMFQNRDFFIIVVLLLFCFHFIFVCLFFAESNRLRNCCQCSFQEERATRTCRTSREATGLARVEESMDSRWMFEGIMVIQGGQTNQMLPWLLSMIFSELFRAHGLPPWPTCCLVPEWFGLRKGSSVWKL